MNEAGRKGKFSVRRVAVILAVALGLPIVTTTVWILAAVILVGERDPWVVVLDDSVAESSEEVWIGVAGYGPPRLYRWIIADAQSRDQKLTAAGNVVKERIYYVFESPLKTQQRDWDVEADEPNDIYRWQDGELQTIKELGVKARNENNEIVENE